MSLCVTLVYTCGKQKYNVQVRMFAEFCKRSPEASGQENYFFDSSQCSISTLAGIYPIVVYIQRFRQQIYRGLEILQAYSTRYPGSTS